MKPLKFIRLFALALLAGCQTAPSTTATRIEEKAKVYAALPADVQKKLQDGMVETGYTANMVYIALGRPTEVAVTADGKVGIWTYKDFYPSAAVSPRPFYSIRAHPVGRDPLAVGPSAAGAHDGGASGPVSHGPRPGGFIGTGWSEPEVRPVTLHVAFMGGHVTQMTVDAS